ncbi:LuxR C-terminal-related transcriptional regulator [Rhodococcus sp. NPDC054953]
MTKFRPPTTGPRSILRLDVLALLDRPARAVVVRAPAGYGKTTVITQWLHHRNTTRPVWVSLDDDDNDPGVLWGAIAAAASAAGLHTKADASSGEVRANMIVPLLDAFAGSPGRWTLVLDDAHLITREQTLASLDWFLGRIPENLTVVVSTRVPLELPTFARLRARGDGIELSSGTLRLGTTQIADLLGGAHDLHLTADDVQRIDDATDGWPAAVSLIGSAMSHGQSLSRVVSQRPDDDAALGALVREGLAGSTRDDYDLLRRMSVFERFDATILTEILQSDRAWTVAMDVADATGLIAALDDDGCWWRLHHLVRERLHAELGRVDPAGRRELHRRAAGHFERANDVTATIHHLLGAEDYDTIADILSNVRANSVVPRQSLGLSWLERIPVSALERDPRLAFWEAWASATGGDAARRDRALARGRLASPTRPVDAFRNWDDVEDFIHGSACYDDVGSARRAGERFLSRYDPAVPLVPLAELRLATMLYLEGRCAEALEVLDRLDQGPPLTRPLRLFVPAYRALCQLELGDRAAAAVAVERCAQARIAFRIGPDPVYLPAEHALARLQIERGDPTLGLTTATSALECARSGGGDTVLVVPHLLIEVARAHLALGNRDEATVALGRAEELCTGAVDPGALPARIAALRERFRLHRTDLGHREALSRRELEVLALLPTPLSASEIASELFVSVNTVRSHVKSIHRKLEVTSRADAVVAARRAGLVGAR